MSAFYLKHRLSEDIDLFTYEQEVDQKLVESFLKKVSPELSVKEIKRSQFLGLVSYKLIYKDNDELKVDFNYYPFLRIDKGTKFKKLEVDSIYDIAANKLHTLFMKPRERDYVDLYFILKKLKYPLYNLIINTKTKFDWDIDKINLANQFLRVTDFKEKGLPKVLVPFNSNKMEKFFLDLAKGLEKDIFK